MQPAQAVQAVSTLPEALQVAALILIMIGVMVVAVLQVVNAISARKASNGKTSRTPKPTGDRLDMHAQNVLTAEVHDMWLYYRERKLDDALRLLQSFEARWDKLEDLVKELAERQEKQLPVTERLASSVEGLQAEMTLCRGRVAMPVVVTET